MKSPGDGFAESVSELLGNQEKEVNGNEYSRWAKTSPFFDVVSSPWHNNTGFDAKVNEEGIQIRLQLLFALMEPTRLFFCSLCRMPSHAPSLRFSPVHSASSSFGMLASFKGRLMTGVRQSRWLSLSSL